MAVIEVIKKFVESDPEKKVCAWLGMTSQD